MVPYYKFQKVLDLLTEMNIKHSQQPNNEKVMWKQKKDETRINYLLPLYCLLIN